jgi:hypothetical protein
LALHLLIVPRKYPFSAAIRHPRTGITTVPARGLALPNPAGASGQARVPSSNQTVTATITLRPHFPSLDQGNARSAGRGKTLTRNT